MDYNNNGFFSNTFLDKWMSSKVSTEERDRIGYFSYAFDMIKEDLVNIKEQSIINRFIEEDFFPALGYSEENVQLDGNIFKIYGEKEGKQEKVYTLKFIKKLNPFSMEFDKYQDLDVIEKAKEDDFKIAIITDGYNWRLYKADVANYFETYIEFDVKEYIEKEKEVPGIRILSKIIHGDALESPSKDEKLGIEVVFEESDAAIEKIEKELKGKMEDILSGIGLGFKDAIVEATGQEKIDEDTRKELYQDSITVLYRTLFIIYAESKGLLPLDNNEYAVNSIQKMIGEATIEGNFDEGIEFWEKLETVFSWIDKGHETANLTLKAYNGGLFDNKDRKILSKYKIKNRHWLKTLLKLSYYESKGKTTGKIDFRDLSTRSFGTLYEGILDYNMFIAEEELVKRVAKSKVSYIPLKETKAKKTEVIIEKGEIYLSEDALERKETGAYYTPEPIVEYIVKNTVDNKVDDALKKIEKEIIDIKSQLEETFNPQLRRGLEEELVERTMEGIRKEVLTLSILDNAMGSGHFLVNASYHLANKIFSFIHKYINYSYESEEEIFSYGYWKRMVVTHSIYGVDINSLAVQLGKLSLWLISASKDRPLSFIDHHIKCGNSLVGTDRNSIDETLGDNIGDDFNRRLFDSTVDTLMAEVDERLKELERMPEETAAEVHEKEVYYEEIQGKLTDIKTKWNIYLSMQLEDKKGVVNKDKYAGIVNSQVDQIENHYESEFQEWKKQSEEYQFFHWELEFPEVFNKENKGFDCIIGNPPYVLLQNTDISDEILEYFKKNYGVASYKVDLYNLFIEKSMRLIKNISFFSYIIPSNFVTNTFSKGFRSFLINKTNIQEICFIEGQVFNVGVNNCLLFLNKDISGSNVINFKKVDFTAFKIRVIEEEKKIQNSFEDLLSFPTSQKTENLIGKIEKESKKLLEIASVNFGMQLRNRKEFKEDVIDLSKEEHTVSEFHKKCFTGKNIKRYSLKYSNLMCYFNREAKKGGCWDEKAHFAKNKILVSQIGKNPEFAIDEYGYPVLNTAFMINLSVTDISSYYLLGVLNSKLIKFYWRSKFSDDRNLFPKIKGTYLKELPIKIGDTENQELIEKLVNRILENKELDNCVIDLEKKLDGYIYNLYDLTQEEIEIIESSLGDE